MQAPGQGCASFGFGVDLGYISSANLRSYMFLLRLESDCRVTGDMTGPYFRRQNSQERISDPPSSIKLIRGGD
jgi:hypothetical protein